MIRASAVVAVHNEEQYLPYCIMALRDSPLYEAIFVLDRCSDRSLNIIEETNFPFKVKVIELKKKQWLSPTAEPFAIGFKEATGDVAYSIGSDIYVDPRIFTVDWSGIDLCSFKCNDYSLFGSSWEKLKAKTKETVIYNYERLKNRIAHRSMLTGIYGFRKTIYDNIQHVDCDAEDSAFLKTCIAVGLRYRYFSWSTSLHLRPCNPRSLKLRAQIAVQQNVPIPRALFYTLKWLDLNYLREYCSVRASLKS
jgi:glycosyltransferase involved in cell wall biosynthesis